MRLAPTGTAVAAAVLLAAAPACSDPAPGGPDLTPPRLRVEFFGLPPGPGETAAPSPNSYSDYSLPTSQRAELGHAYQLTATLEDPEGGVEFFAVSEGKPLAECWLPGRTTIDARGPLLSPVTPGQARRTPDAGTATVSPPAALPTRRALSLEVRTDVAGGCPAGRELRWTITIAFGGVNGAGLPPRGANLTAPTTTPASGDAIWGLTDLVILRPAS
jgi:hypothetical protein